MAIRLIRDKVSQKELEAWAQETYKEMIKAVVDIQRQLLAVGGELHADAEANLLEDGSRQEDLWGINLYLAHPEQERIEYHSLINVKPRQGHRSMEVLDPSVKERIRRIVDARIAWE